MGNYAEASEVMEVLQPTAASSMTVDRIGFIINEVESEVDARLSVLYQMPVTASPTPWLLKKITIDYACYRAMLEYRGTKDLEQRDPAQLRLDEAKQLLEALANGEAVLPDVPGVEHGDGGAGDPHNVLEGDAFTLGDWRLGFDPTRHGTTELGVRWWEHGC